MGYTTDFHGQFKIDRPLRADHALYLAKFSATRRMRRDPVLAKAMPDPVRLAVGLPISAEGGYFVGGTGSAGQDHDPSVLDYNKEPCGQPSLWCQWAPTKDGTGIKWNGTEKFHDYTEWLQYLMDHFLTRWGYTLSGEVHYEGESLEDVGVVRIVKGKAKKIPLRPIPWAQLSERGREMIIEAMHEAACDAKGVDRKRWRSALAYLA